MVERFYEFMLSGSLWWIAGVGLLLAPFSVLVHELGHALAALLVTSGPVRVDVGQQRDQPPHFRVGRISFRFNHYRTTRSVLSKPVGAVPGGSAIASTYGVSRSGHLAVTVAGPAASLALAVLYATVADQVTGLASVVLWGLSAMETGGLIMNLFPRGFGDGGRIIKLLRAYRFVPGGPGAVPDDAYRALLESVPAWAAAPSSDPVCREIESWVNSILANDDRAPGGAPEGAYVPLVTGLVGRWHEGAASPSERVSATVARGPADPVAAVALDRYADELAAEEVGPETAALRFHLVMMAPSKRAALEALRWFDVGRALADVISARSAPVASAVS
jgi:hypothetical protein